MGVSVDLRVVELLAARLCHELITPVGAISNGVELISEEKDPDFTADALKLLASSAKTAGSRLNFYRFAYGSGRGGSARDATLGLLAGGKVKAEWNETATALPADWQRLACNLAVLAAEALPRGGSVCVEAPSGAPAVVVNAAGDSINLSEELRAALGDAATASDLTARTVHAYHTARIAEALGARVEIATLQAGKLVLTTRPI